MQTIRIFAYGSLINKQSLKQTVPSANSIKPARLYGFVRIFNLKSSKWFCKKNNSYCCVLNLEKSETNEYINGVTFETSLSEFSKLKEQERNYELVQVEVEDFKDPNTRYKAYVFRALHFEAYNYLNNSKEQKHYLDSCLKGCKDFGKEFLEEFKNTTYIGNKTLKELDY